MVKQHRPNLRQTLEDRGLAPMATVGSGRHLSSLSATVEVRHCAASRPSVTAAHAGVWLSPRPAIVDECPLLSNRPGRWGMSRSLLE
jgi:hypothetical protein